MLLQQPPQQEFSTISNFCVLKALLGTSFQGLVSNMHFFTTSTFLDVGPLRGALLCGPARRLFGHPGSPLKRKTLESSKNIVAASTAATLFDDFETMRF